MNIDLYDALLHMHSVGRWAVLLFLLFAIINSLIAGRRPFLRTDARLGLILLIFADLMLVIGFYLWFVGPWGYNLLQGKSMSEIMRDPVTRFFAVEHFAGMIIAVVLIHIGKAQGRRHISDKSKHRRTMVYYLLALLIILVSIPWPFREIGAARGWY